ncbi:MAG: GNAT family N-acetyltransferase [Candidatus Lokiarchaeota archaeon]|nr:GNAT family N-acetyltransferase [Candidatus Lokiarchaeota archaeon]
MIFDIEVIEEINDKSLFIRKIAKTDAKFLFNSLDEEKLNVYLSLGPLTTLEDSKRLIKRYLKYWERYAQYNYIIEVRDPEISKVGSISLWNVNWRHKRAEVGIWVNPSNWKCGYGKKSLNLIKIIAFNHLKLNRLEAHIATENLNSIRLFKGCNFKEEGNLRQYLNQQETYHNALVLSCLKDDSL